MAETKLVLMVGISGSGKSTMAEVLKQKYNFVTGIDTIIVSSDALRKELLGDEDNQSQNNRIFDELRKRINNNLSKKNVIVDATNLTIKSRRSILAIGKQFPECEKIAIVMITPINVAKFQNKQRDRIVPDYIIDLQVARFEIPFYEEGFDKIELTGGDFKNFSPLPLKKWMTEEDSVYCLMKGFDQKTKHHKYTLEKHCELCAEKIKELSHDIVLYRAAQIHDVGKVFTGKPKEDGSGDYRYIGHHNVGAYTLLQNLVLIGFYSYDNILKCLFYINYHMLPFFIETDKAKKKWESIMGKENLDRLFLFNQCDRYASGTN